MKNRVLWLVLACFSACTSIPDNGDIEDATVFHWDNEHVTMAKFVQDHKGCLGIKKSDRNNSLMKLLSPMEPENVPQWDSIWATFESRQYKEAGQRIAFSLPSGGAPSTHNYQECMEGLGYSLTYRR